MANPGYLVGDMAKYVFSFGGKWEHDHVHGEVTRITKSHVYFTYFDAGLKDIIPARMKTVVFDRSGAGDGWFQRQTPDGYKNLGADGGTDAGSKLVVTKTQAQVTAELQVERMAHLHVVQDLVNQANRALQRAIEQAEQGESDLFIATIAEVLRK